MRKSFIPTPVFKKIVKKITSGLMKTFPEVKFFSSSAMEKLPELLKYKIPDAVPSVKNLVADFVLEQGLNDIREHTKKKELMRVKPKKSSRRSQTYLVYRKVNCKKLLLLYIV